jgi:hydrogenase-4 component B
LGLTVGAAALGVVCSVGALTGAGSWEWRSTFALGGETIHLRFDAISAIFLMLVSVVGGAGAVYARGYWSDSDQPRAAARGRAWWSAMVLSMGLVLVVSNGLHFLLVWEAFALSAYFLITLDSDRRAVREAGWLYLAASHAGTLLLFAFFGALAARTGTWDLGPLHDQPQLAPLFWLALFGFGVKAGLFPLHVWLPPAHANAPSHVSAIMSGVALKMGVYGWVRFSGWMPAPVQAGWVLLGLGAVSAVLGIWFALAQNDMKRLLAYCSVENIGIIAIGLGGALLGVARGSGAWGSLLLAGAMLHIWNHGLFKSLLFLGAGSILHATHTREMSRMGGLWRHMPWTAAFFVFGSAAICALPPLNGLVSEWLVYVGLFRAVQAGGAAGWAMAPAAILLALSGALALATFVKAGSVMLLGAPRSAAAEHAHECGWLMRSPMLFLAIGCAVIGLAPTLVWPALARAVACWRPAWVSVPTPMLALGRANLALAIALSLGALVVLWRVRALGVRRGPTWDCGFAAPSRRMQYTSASFAGLPVGWLSGLLGARMTRRRPRGLFPVNAVWLERIPDTVLEKVIDPMAGLFLWLAQGARNLQQGHLPSYIVYLLIGLAVLAGMVGWGEWM